MSHYAILQISKQPIRKEDYFCADSYYYDDYNGNVIGSAVDYIRDMDEQEAQDWLEFTAEHPGPGYSIDAKARTFTVVSRAKYWKKHCERTQEACKKILAMGLDEFMNPDAAWIIEDVSYFGNDRYGMQLSEYDGFCYSIDHFMRVAHDGDVYYIGAVMDYHM